MALSPRESTHFFPETISTSSRQRFQGLSDLRNLTVGIPKFPNLSPLNSSGFHDPNITLLLQHWLLNSLRGAPSFLQNNSNFQPQNFPTNPALIPSITEPYKQDFMLQDLHQKYKTFLADYQSSAQRTCSPHLNCMKRLNSKPNITPFTPTFLPFPYLNNPFCFPFPSPNFEKISKPPFSRLPSQFYPLRSRDPSPQIESTTKATIQSVGVEEEMTSRERSPTADLFKDKKTHKCMYCGKLYSRKYGLKIHIRTHTGYKPLKCKVRITTFTILAWVCRWPSLEIRSPPSCRSTRPSINKF